MIYLKKPQFDNCCFICHYTSLPLETSIYSAVLNWEFFDLGIHNTRFKSKQSQSTLPCMYEIHLKYDNQRRYCQ